jgi:hypothetical protein
MSKRSRVGTSPARGLGKLGLRRTAGRAPTILGGIVVVQHGSMQMLIRLIFPLPLRRYRLLLKSGHFNDAFPSIGETQQPGLKPHAGHVLAGVAHFRSLQPSADTTLGTRRCCWATEPMVRSYFRCETAHTQTYDTGEP